MIGKAAEEVGAPLFFSLIIITLSFVPVFALEGQEGKMFSPLAFTKTYVMAAAAGLAITLVPVLMGYFIRGNVLPEHKNPVNRSLVAMYKPLLNLSLKYPKVMIVIALGLMASAYYPTSKLGSEFIPPLDEGDLMYMPTTYPGISIGKARELLQQTNKLIKTIPEVETTWGKIGRAETATDPAPLTMIETVIQLKPRDEWRDGVTTESLRKEFDDLIQFPGLTNAWVMPIKTRIDMLATGIKTPIGIKIAGPDLSVIEDIGSQLEPILNNVSGTASVYAERVAGGRYVTIDIKRRSAARYGLSIKEVQQVISTAVGGMNVGETVEGLERYPINVRYPQSYRDSVVKLQNLPLVTPNGARIALSDVADIRYEDGPPMIKTENARPNGWVFVDIEGRDLGSYVAEAQKVVSDQIVLPAGYSLAWSGQYEYMERAKERLSVVVPITIIMLVYLNQAWHYKKLDAEENQQALQSKDLTDAIREGAGLRVRPVMMTVLTVIIGLIPIMYGEGTGSEVMQRIAAPMIGGMASALLLTLLVLPAIFKLWKQREITQSQNETSK